MRKIIYYIICMLLVTACENTPVKKSELPPKATTPIEFPLDREIKKLLEKGISMGERKRQVAAIEIAFARHTGVDRARQLAALCFTKTLGTPFMPCDLAEIALVESGGHRLSASATSTKGALGVWQLMPNRAKSHGYTPADMKNDEKCAEAAVRELHTKLDMAQGNLEQAKKLYCGQGAQADAYMRKIRVVRQEIAVDMARSTEKFALEENGVKTR